MTAAPVEDGALQPALTRLHDAISKLIDPQQVPLDHGRRTWIDSPYSQLSDAVAGQSGARSGGTSTVPIWPEVVDLLRLIDTTVRKWAWKRFRALDTPSRLFAIADAKFRPQDAAQLQQWATELQSWVVEIGSMLDPPMTVPLPYACPVCRTEWVSRRDSAGEPVRQRALTVSADGTARCAARARDVTDPPDELWRCGARWESSRLPLLGRMLRHADAS